MPNQIDDRSLVCGIIEGNEKYLKILVSHYMGRLVSYLESMGFLHQDAIEIANDTLYKAVKNIQVFDLSKGTKFSTWLTRIAINTAKDRLKRDEKLSVEESLEERSDKGYIDNTPLWSKSEIPESDLNLLSKNVLNKAMLKISDIERRLIMNRVYGLTHKQIGMLVGKSENAVKVGYHRAIKRLKEQYITLIESLNEERAHELRSFLFQEDTYEKNQS